MPEFADPFRGTVPDRKMTLSELVRALRLDLAAEEEAIHLYMAHAEATDHELAKRVLIDIANEERQHVGEFARLIQILTGDEDQWQAEGAAEVNDMAAGVPKEVQPEDNGKIIQPGNVPGPKTIGSLRE